MVEMKPDVVQIVYYVSVVDSTFDFSVCFLCDRGENISCGGGVCVGFHVVLEYPAGDERY